MKEIFMEVYEQYDGEIPVGFDFDKYITEKHTQEKYSPCCGVNMNTQLNSNSFSYSELGVCPKCFESC